MKSTIMNNYEKESSFYYSTARLWDDGVILPEDTRKVLGLSVLIASNNIQETRHGVFRMWFAIPIFYYIIIINWLKGSEELNAKNIQNLIIFYS